MANAVKQLDPTDAGHHRLNLRPRALNRTIATVAGPAILDNLMLSMVFLVDTLIIGRLHNATFLAANALASLIMFWSNAPAQGLSIATVSIISRTWGEKDFNESRRLAAHCLIMTFIIVAGILLIGVPCAEWIIQILRSPQDVTAPAAAYLRIVLFSSALGLPLFISNGIIRAKGDTVTPMLITLTMNIINIIASLTLAFGIGPFPEMGFYGVAWGTLIARNIGGLLSLAVLSLPGKGIGLRIVDVIQLRSLAFARIWHVAYPAMAERIINCTCYAAFVAMVAELGKTLLAGHQIALRVESLAFMPAFGMSVAVTTILGQAVGSGRYRIAEITVKRSILFSSVMMIALSILFVLFAPYVVWVFGATPAVLKQAGLALQIAAIELPFFALAFIFNGALRGSGDTRSPFVVNIGCILLLRLPFTWLFTFVLGWGIVGVWLATALDWAGRSLGLWWVFRKGVWKMIHKREKQTFADD